ncbi:uncharacterized protein LOC111065115 [Drosophila obscura]|uniref:uncharacterized protein LOC111065115 n=1 Tax=Drosophila obscura TaxID=7282 RepID=UPI001BB28583|nr:uncharacterized protein LOC111065115 [Drosophila obscura]
MMYTYHTIDEFAVREVSLQRTESLAVVTPRSIRAFDSDPCQRGKLLLLQSINRRVNIGEVSRVSDVHAQTMASFIPRPIPIPALPAPSSVRMRVEIASGSSSIHIHNTYRYTHATTPLLFPDRHASVDGDGSPIPSTIKRAISRNEGWMISQRPRIDTASLEPTGHRQLELKAYSQDLASL